MAIDDATRRILNNQGMIMLALRCLLVGSHEHLRGDLNTAITATAEALGQKPTPTNPQRDAALRLVREQLRKVHALNGALHEEGIVSILRLIDVMLTK